LWNQHKEATITKLGVPKGSRVNCAKNEGYIVRLNVVDPRYQMETNVSKWWKITYVINVNGHPPLARNGVACKGNWGAIYGNLKYIFNYMLRIKNNRKYWNLTFNKESNFEHPSTL
jgi:hypothetical protein